jgi:hypothetical protein
MKDLITTVVYINCAIAIAMFVVTLQTLKLRAQIVAIANWCDRQEREWDLLMAIDARQSIEAGGTKIRSVRQLYQQQLSTIDRLRRVRSVLGVARTVARQRIRMR